MLFGPSESLVIADDAADPAIARRRPPQRGRARERLGRAPRDSVRGARRCRRAGGRARSSRGFPSRGADSPPLPSGVTAAPLLVADLEEACAFANEYAPEHLQIATREPEALVARLEHAGEILIGADAVLRPRTTSSASRTRCRPVRFARVSSGVTARTFAKTSSIGRVSPGALAGSRPALSRSPTTRGSRRMPPRSARVEFRRAPSCSLESGPMAGGALGRGCRRETLRRPLPHPRATRHGAERAFVADGSAPCGCCSTTSTPRWPSTPSS